MIWIDLEVKTLNAHIKSLKEEIRVLKSNDRYFEEEINRIKLNNE